MSNEYYQKNKEKWKQYYLKRKTDPEKKKKYNETRKIWRHGKGKSKEKISKQKSDKKYYEKIKTMTEFKLKKKLYGQEYYQKNKEHHNLIMKKHRAKPEVKKQNAEYNKKYQQENPDIVLKNIRNHLNRLGKHHDLKWHQFLDQLRGWSEIIHKDNNETCQICFEPSQEAHHILHKSKYPQLTFNRNNGIALCQKCHNQAHGKMLITIQ